MQIIKRHAKELYERNLPISSQVHIAMRFFGRLIASNTLQEINRIVRLGHYIFKSRYVDSTLLKTLDNFSDDIHNFNNAHPQENDSHIEISNSDSGDETNMENDDLPTELSVKISMKEYWDHELTTMESSKVSSGDLNKYFMPKYFDYILKNYLPSCTLWSGLLLGDLRRYNRTFSTPSNLQPIPDVRDSQVDNKTNAEVENFFKIKKNVSFKGNRQLRLDSFIGENWIDNKALQREFVDSLLKGAGKKNKNLQKVEQLCSLAATSGVQDNSDNSDIDQTSDSRCPKRNGTKQFHE